MPGPGEASSLDGRSFTARLDPAAPVPMHARVGRRRTREGGLDVPVPMPS